MDLRQTFFLLPPSLLFVSLFYVTDTYTGHTDWTVSLSRVLQSVSNPQEKQAAAPVRRLVSAREPKPGKCISDSDNESPAVPALLLGGQNSAGLGPSAPSPPLRVWHSCSCPSQSCSTPPCPPCWPW